MPPHVPERRSLLKTKVTAGFAVAVLMLVSLGVISYRSIAGLVADVQWDNHTYAAIATIHELHLQLSSLESNGRGYVGAGDSRDLERYRAAADAAKVAFLDLQDLTRDNSAQQQRLAGLKPLLKQKLEFLGGLIERRRQGETVETLQSQMFEVGSPLMDKMRDILRDMAAEENILLAGRLAETSSSARRTKLIIGIGSAFALIVVTLARWMIHSDITGRERTESVLRESEERFRLLVDGAKEYAILMLDADGKIKTWNTGAERILGYRADEVVGQHFSRFLPEEDVRRGAAHDELTLALEKGQYEKDDWRIRKDGSRFWANVLITCLRDETGKPIGFSKITRDLTERRRAAEQERVFFSLSLDLLCIAGFDGYFKQLNPAWESALGFTDAELRGKPFMEFIHPGDHAATTNTMTQKLAAGETVVDFENRYLCKDGSYRWLTWNAAVSSDRQLIYAAARDITEQKRVANAVAELNTNLERSNTQLQAANKELEAFSYSVSHDLRAPLRSIDGFSQALLEDYSEQLDEEAKSHLARVRAASQRMGHLIDDLLNLSRVTRTELIPETVEISKVAREIAEELRSAAPERDVEIVIADGLVVQTDARLLRIMLSNLLGNAWKFTGKREHARIELGWSGENGKKAFFVRDNGAGFDMNYAGKLFGAFQRMHDAKDFPGTGIGLATVQRIVQRQGGQIWAESAPELGTTFHFTL